MQAVIMAAGRGERMGSLTENTPKVMLEVAGKTLLEHKFDILPDVIDEIILVVGYMGSTIQKRFGGAYEDKRIIYVEQDTLDGTAGALWKAKELLKNDFLVLNGDDIYSPHDLVRVVAKTGGWRMLVQEISEVRTGGSVEVDSESRITNIVENHSAGGKAGLVGTNMFVFDTKLFDYPMVPKEAGSHEYGLPQTALAAAKASNTPFYAIPGSFWLQITSPEDLKAAEEALKKADFLA